MEGLVFKYWIQEIERYPNYRFIFELCDNNGVAIMCRKEDGLDFRWEKYYTWEDIKHYRLPDLLSKFVAEYNFNHEEEYKYIRREEHGKE